MAIKNKIVKGLTATVLATGAVAGFSGSAWAGGNGQQIRYYENHGNVRGVEIWGTNQNGQYVSHCFAVTPNRNNDLGGWWWKGRVGYLGYDNAGCKGGYIDGSGNYPEVPESQSGDWFNISG